MISVWTPPTFGPKDDARKTMHPGLVLTSIGSSLKEDWSVLDHDPFPSAPGWKSATGDAAQRMAKSGNLRLPAPWHIVLRRAFYWPRGLGELPPEATGAFAGGRRQALAPRWLWVKTVHHPF